MKRRVFFSFHYEKDNWRASQIRNMGILEGNPPISDNDWESIKREGDKAIQNWIESQIKGKTCCIVLIGEETYRRRWINFEIKLAWKMGLGVLGIYVFIKTALKINSLFSFFYSGKLFCRFIFYRNYSRKIFKWIFNDKME